MNPERWQQVDQLFQAALERAPDERPVFLNEACGADDSLRREVEALLAADGQAGSLIETPAYALAAPLIIASDAKAFFGKTIGHYQIIALLGKGGMGEVYRARDLKLDRTAALKILPAEVAAGAERMRRFIREAKAASALNHPNVAHIYEIGEADGVSFIAMECVEGQTLAAKINGQPLAVSEIVEIGIQIADALDEAHGKGITHRDIKPANVMLTPRGQVKVLDFGLAKIARPAQPITSEISTLAKTAPGVVMGTVPYMSPEQALGREVDQRSDLFSLGVVLYEMATGRLPFAGANASETLNLILHSQPEAIARFNYDVPTELERIVRKCLEKECERRYQSARELLVDLKNLKRESDSAVQRTVKAGRLTNAVNRPKWQAPLLFAGLLVAAISLAWFNLRTLPLPKVTDYKRITNDVLPKTGAFLDKMTSLVTDGARVYFTEYRNGQVVLAQAAAAGGETVLITTPFSGANILDISPNGAELLVASGIALTEEEHPLLAVPVLGGSPRRLGTVSSYGGAAWSPDGRRIIYIHGSHLYLANSDGTEPRDLVTLDKRISYPRWSPDGKLLRFTVGTPHEEAKRALWEVNADGSNLHPLLPGWDDSFSACCGNWTPDGKYYVFQATQNKSTQVWALPEPGGLFAGAKPEPVQLTNGPLNYHFPVPSRDGGKIFAVGVQERVELISYDTVTKQFVPYLKDLSAEQLDYSKDREWVTYVTYPEGDLWRCKLAGSARLQLSFAPLQAALPRWSPDGKRIAFAGKLPGKPWKLYLVSSEGGAPQQLMPEERTEFDPNWSPDGNTLVFGNFTTLSINLLDLRTRQVSLLPGSDGLFSPRWSPDGRYIIALPRAAESLMLYDFQTQKWTEITRAKVLWPLWSRDGKYIYFDLAFRLRIADRKLEQVASKEGLRQGTGSFGPWTGLTADEAPLVLRDVGTQDIYALEWKVP